jgi:hypothetical protein
MSPAIKAAIWGIVLAYCGLCAHLALSGRVLPFFAAVSVVFMAFAAIALHSGAYEAYGATVLRADRPFMYWASVAATIAIAIAILKAAQPTQ